MSRTMRIALVSPYSWTYPGGVTRHIEALAERASRRGPRRPRARALRPRRPPRRASAPRRAAAGAGGCPSTSSRSGARSASRPTARCRTWRSRRTRSSTLRRELRSGGFDVVHVHEPVAPIVGWDTLMLAAAAARRHLPLLLRRTVSPTTSRTLLGARRRLNRLHVRIAVSEAAAWTGRRFYGGRYRVIPNGVDVAASRRPAVASRDGPLRIALRRPGRRAQGPAGPAARLRGAARARPRAADARRRRRRTRSSRCCSTTRGVDGARARSTTSEKDAALRERRRAVRAVAGGESFGMVLTEAFAAGTPVVASDIAGYRDVVRDGVDGVLVPRGDATALAETLRDLALDPSAARAMARRRARARAGATPGRTSPPRCSSAYEDAIAAAPAPERGVAAASPCAPAALPADGEPRAPADAGCRRSSRRAVDGAGRARRIARRAAFVLAALVGGAGLGALALQRIGIDQIGTSLLESSPTWVLVGLGADVRLDGRCARSPGTRSCARRCRRRGEAVATRCRAPSSAC